MTAPYWHGEPDAPCDIRDAPTAGSDRALIQQMLDALNGLYQGSQFDASPAALTKAWTAAALAILAGKRRLGVR